MDKKKSTRLRPRAADFPKPRETVGKRRVIDSPSATTTGRAHSSVMQLAEEIDRLQAELSAARARLIELEAKAEIDPLLNVYNRQGFGNALARALSYAKRYGALAALVYLDLDGLKSINDNHGHAAGDAVLAAAATALTRNIRASDFVGRLGGDEFAILLWNLDEAAAARKAMALEAAVAETHVDWNGARLSVGGSAGAVMLRAEETAAALLARADRAMYARKQARRCSASLSGR
jgi:diguanylate cyclase (GGDEF)-like protein